VNRIAGAEPEVVLPRYGDAWQLGRVRTMRRAAPVVKVVELAVPDGWVAGRSSCSWTSSASPSGRGVLVTMHSRLSGDAG
jgi:hypothetical protein